MYNKVVGIFKIYLVTKSSKDSLSKLAVTRRFQGQLGALAVVASSLKSFYNLDRTLLSIGKESR